MLLLRFSAQNHKSLRELAELDLVSSALKKHAPEDGHWPRVVYPAAVILGANASGKSNVLDALLFLKSAVQLSSTTWLQRPNLPQPHFRLDEESSKAPSTYTIEMVIDGVRYEYGFSIRDGASHREWLLDYPGSRSRNIFTRQVGAELTTNREFKNLPTQLSPRELLMSRAASIQHPQLNPIAQALIHDIDVLTDDKASRDQRQANILRNIAEGKIDATALATILFAADVGIKDVSIQWTKASADFVKFRETLQRVVKETYGEEFPSSAPDADSYPEISFHHDGSSQSTAFGLEHESTGTIAWMVLACSAVSALNQGHVFVVDELDASLHPHLAAALVSLFNSSTFNHLGAQIIFTSHDVSLLEPTSAAELTAEQVWFTDKTNDGATQLFCLDDYSPRPGQNPAKRYLEGRYGSVPRLATSFLDEVVESRMKGSV